MKILILTSVYKDDSLGNRDTSTNIVNSFAREWATAGHEVLVVHNAHCYFSLIHNIPACIKKIMASRMGFMIADYDAVCYKEYDDYGVKVYRLPIKKYIPHCSPGDKTIIDQVRKIDNILKKEHFVPDIITGHWASPQMEIIAKLKDMYHCPTTVVLHGLGYINDSKFNAKRYLPYIDHIGARSVFQSEKIKKLLKLDDLPFVCYSGVPDNYIGKYELNVDKFNNIKKWRFSFVGRLVKYKNIDAVIRALTELDGIDWEFDVVGDGAAKNELELLARHLKCSDRVNFHGKVSRDKVMEILNDTHCFIMISTNEIFGLVYLEAMAASSITIASKYGGIDGIIYDCFNGFLSEEGDYKKLSQKLKNIVSMPTEEIKNVVVNGYNTANNYTDKKVAEYYLEKIKK